MIRLDIINDRTGTQEIGNYTYRIYTPFTLLAEGMLKGHTRSDGWKILLDKIIDKVYRTQDLY
jgi:hypothetical protein